MTQPPASYAQEGPVAVITMDDGKANAMSYEMMDAVSLALSLAEREAQAVVLAGRQGRFSAGFDLRVMMSGVDQARALVSRGADFLLSLYAFPMPLVIACTGHALAGGALIVLTGDVRIGTRGAYKVGLNEVQLGMPVPVLAMELARDRLVPPHLLPCTLHARTGAPDEALSWGYFDAVVDEGELRARAIAEATRLTALPREAYAKTKMSLRERTIKYVRDTLEEDMKRLTPPVT